MHPWVGEDPNDRDDEFLRETMVGFPPRSMSARGSHMTCMFLSQIPWKICLKALYLSG